MVDFAKRLSKDVIEKKVNPIEIYESLDRRSIAGPLRPAQKAILDKWYLTKKDDKDLIIKLHTGEGKTLIGLLILQSKLNSGDGPCMFICPNRHLVEQVCLDAKKFGINYCKIGLDKSIPNEFIDGEKILITHIQKVFNGRTKFGLGNDFVDVKNIVLDDSHACIDSIKSTFTINVKADHGLYKELNNLFKDEISDQGEGTYMEIENGDYNSFLPIPYWSWIDKSEDVLQIISKYREDNRVAFTWPIIKDNLDNCQAFISGQNLEITPIHIPIEKFSSFSKAKQRILMSATTQDDSFFIKGLGFEKKAVKNPLDNQEQIWSGEKMVLIPALIDESLDRDHIVNLFAPSSEKNYGIVSLVASFRKTEQYEQLGGLVATADKIDAILRHLKKGNYKETIVFANRYDGIDLPDEHCRILIIDGKPFFYSLADRYEECNRQESDFINVRVAQRIEQGLGRSVRGEKDYSLILLIGGDLIQFVKSSRTNKYFSPQTKKQIEIGIEIAKMAKEDISDQNEPSEVIKSLMKQSLQRNYGWKEFYKKEMNALTQNHVLNDLHTVLILEKDAAVASYVGDNEKACSYIQKILDNHCADNSDRGWYLQAMARYTYFLSKTESNSLQKSAFRINQELLKPKEGLTYKKLEYINENRIIRIKNWIKDKGNYEELMLAVDSIISDLQFGTNAEKFEMAFKNLGLMIGFLSERPDKEHKKGPDNLWCGVSNQYFIFECKSEVKEERKEIYKTEAGQMNTHCAWFENQYGDAAVKRVLVIPTIFLSYQADFTHEVRIMRRGKLKSLRSNVKAFFKEFKKYEVDSLSDDKIQEFIETHKLDVNSLKCKYSEDYNKS